MNNRNRSMDLFPENRSKDPWKRFAPAAALLVCAQLIGQFFYGSHWIWSASCFLLYAGGFLSAFLFGRNLPLQIEKEPNRLTRVSVVIALLFGGAIMRFAYVNTVFFGFNWETLNFFWFADAISESWVFQPYAWYTHTQLSYIIAVFFGILGKSLFTYKIVLALISCAAICAAFLWLRKSVSFRVASIGALFLICSSLHLFHSRNGYNHTLVLLWQAVSYWLLFVAMRTRRTVFGALAGLSIGLGLYSQWGFYYTPIFLYLFLNYKLFQEKGFLRRQWINVTVIITLSVLMFIPFYLSYTEYRAKPFSMKYTSQQITAPTASAWKTTFPDRLVRLFPHILLNRPLPDFNYEYPLLGITVGFFSIFGFAICLARYKHDGHFFIALLAVCSLLATLFAKRTVFYSYPLILPAAALAAVGFDAVWSALKAYAGSARRYVSIAAVLFFAASYVQGYNAFFHEQSDWRECNPLRNRGFMLSDVIRESEAKTVMFHRGEFSKMILRLACVTEDDSVTNAPTLDLSGLIFRGDADNDNDLVELVMGGEIFKDIFPAVSKLYSNAQVIEHPAPKPYKLDVPILYSIIIDPDSLVQDENVLHPLHEDEFIQLEGESFSNKGFYQPGDFAWKWDNNGRAGYFGRGFLLGAPNNEPSSRWFYISEEGEYNVWVRFWPGRQGAGLDIDNDFEAEFRRNEGIPSWSWRNLGTVCLADGDHIVNITRRGAGREMKIRIDAVMLIKDPDLDPSKSYILNDGDRHFLLKGTHRKHVFMGMPHERRRHVRMRDNWIRNLEKKETKYHDGKKK